MSDPNNKGKSMDSSAIDMADQNNRLHEDSQDYLTSSSDQNNEQVNGHLLMRKDQLARDNSDAFTVGSTLTNVSPMPHQRPDITENTDDVPELKPRTTSSRTRTGSPHARFAAGTPDGAQSMQSERSSVSDRAHDFMFAPVGDVNIHQFFPEIELRPGHVVKSQNLIDAAEENDSDDEEDNDNVNENNNENKETNQENKELVKYEPPNEELSDRVDMNDYERPDSVLTDVTIDDLAKPLEDDNNSRPQVHLVENATKGSTTKQAALTAVADESNNELIGVQLQSSEPLQDNTAAFTTEVSEENIQCAKQSQRSRLFNPEEWNTEEVTEPLPTMRDILSEAIGNHMSRAREFMMSQGYEDAIRSYTKALNLQPNIVEAYVNRAEAYVQLCDLQSAILNYKKVCCLEPSDLKYFKRLAFIYYFQGQCFFDQKLFPEALESFSRAAEMEPQVVGYHTRSVACLAALQRHGECLALVNKRLETETTNSDLFVMRARLHEMFRNLTLCYYDVKDALALNPEHKEAIKLQNKLQLKSKESKEHAIQLNLMGKHRDALQKISTAIEADPTTAKYHVIRGALHRKLGDFNAAIDDYLLALDKTDHNEEDRVYIDSTRQLLLTYNDFAVECFQKGYYEESIILLNKAVKGEKNEKGLYINRGDCFFRQGEYAFAQADYHQALEMDPSDQSVRSRISVIQNEYGVNEYQEKNYVEAESRFCLAIQLNPKIGQYYVSRARARYMMENHSGARQDILISLHLDPANPEIISLMTRLFPGKTVTDIMNSRASQVAKQSLQEIISGGVSVKQESASPQENDDHCEPSMVDTLFWKPGHTFPSIRACMEEQEFHIKIVKGKQKINTKVKTALKDRKSLRYAGPPRLQPLPEPIPFPRKGGGLLKEEVTISPVKSSKTTSSGWRTFTMGVSLLK